MLIFLLIVSVIIFIIAIYALKKGHIKRLIPSRKAAFYTMVGAICAIITFGATLDVSLNVFSKEADKPVEEGEEFLLDLSSITIEENITINDENLTIHGRTNLDSGAVISYEIYNENDPESQKSGEIEVINGAFIKEYNLAEFEDGDITVWIGFIPNAQPDHIISAYDVSDGDMDQYIHEDEKQFEISTKMLLAGSEDLTTDLFKLDSGGFLSHFVYLDIAYDGDGPFIVEVKNRSNNTVATLVDTKGSYDGQSIGFIDHPGYYYIEITADGDYEGYATQEAIDVRAMDEEITGTGDDIVFIEMEGGERDFEISHNGDGEFLIMLNDYFPLVEATGNYEGTKTENFGDWIFIFVITADGDWEISIE